MDEVQSVDETKNLCPPPWMHKLTLLSLVHPILKSTQWPSDNYFKLVKLSLISQCNYYCVFKSHVIFYIRMFVSDTVQFLILSMSRVAKSDNGLWFFSAPGSGLWSLDCVDPFYIYNPHRSGYVFFCFYGSGSCLLSRFKFFFWGGGWIYSRF